MAQHRLLTGLQRQQPLAEPQRHRQLHAVRAVALQDLHAAQARAHALRRAVGDRRLLEELLAELHQVLTELGAPKSVVETIRKLDKSE